MHQPHTYFMLWANQGSWIFQCPITLQSCICQVLWVRQFQVPTFWVWVSHCNFPLFLFVPGALNSLFSTWFIEFYVEALKQHEARFDKGKKWLADEHFFSSSALLHSHFSTSSDSASATLCSPFLSSILSITLLQYLFLIVTLNQVFCLHPLFCSLFGAYSRTVSQVPFPPSISCSCSVYHGQLTKSGIHSLFSPQAFNTVFNTKPQRWKAKEGE